MTTRDPHTSGEQDSTDTDPVAERRAAVRKALDRHAKKLARKVDALEGDLAEARNGPEWRRFGEALLAYAHQVPARSASVTLSDPSDPDQTLTIELDPAVAAPANAARASSVPPRLSVHCARSRHASRPCAATMPSSRPS
jgi:predicted ribosome quality control (RQC) complex YloA/Tae2 family protein